MKSKETREKYSDLGEKIASVLEKNLIKSNFPGT